MNALKRRENPFFDLYEDEYIVAVIRRHWLAFLGNIILVTIFLIMFVVGVVILGRLIAINNASVINDIQEGAQSAISNNIGVGFLIVFGSMYLLSVIGSFFISWLDYYLDIFVLTNKRIIRFEQIILFGKKVSETSFQHVQDVSSKVHGVINTMFNVGTVFVETAGENENFAFDTVKDPGTMSAQILELQRGMWDEEGKKSDFGYMGEKKDGNIDSDSIPSEVDCVKIGEQEFCKVPATESQPAIRSDEGTVQTKEMSSPAVRIAPDIPGNALRATVPSVPEAQGGVSQKYGDGRIVTSYGVIWQSEQNPTPDVLDTLNSMDKNSVIAELGEW